MTTLIWVGMAKKYPEILYNRALRRCVCSPANLNTHLAQPPMCYPRAFAVPTCMLRCPCNLDCLNSVCPVYILTCAHPVTKSLSHSVTQSLSHSVTQSVTHPVTQSLSHSVTQSLSHSSTHSLTHSITRSLVALGRWATGCHSSKENPSSTLYLQHCSPTISWKPVSSMG